MTPPYQKPTIIRKSKLKGCWRHDRETKSRRERMKQTQREEVTQKTKLQEEEQWEGKEG